MTARDRAVREALLLAAVRGSVADPWPVARFQNDHDLYRLVATMDTVAHQLGLWLEREIDETCPGWVYVSDVHPRGMNAKRWRAAQVRLGWREVA